jgi:hypothetical protein
LCRFVFNTTYLVDPDCFFPVQAALLASPPSLLGATPHAQNDVSRFPIRTLVSFSLKDDFVALGRAAGHVERKVRRVLEDLLASARGTLPDDDAAVPATFVARHLRLREHAREDLLLDDAHAGAAAFGTWVNVPVRGGA